jgi:peroxin-12
MSFVSLGGSAGARPTFFEVYAADKLVPSLRAAIVYSLSVRLAASGAVFQQRRRCCSGVQPLNSAARYRMQQSTPAANKLPIPMHLPTQVFGQSRGWVQRLLEYEDEVVAAVTLLLDRHSLRSLDATFAESLYGLKREHRPGSSLGGSASQQPQQQQQGGAAGSPLGRSGENWALLCCVLLPYLQTKTECLYTRHAPQLQHGVLGVALRRAAATGGGGRAGSSGNASWSVRLQRGRAVALALFVRAYPYVHAGVEAARFAYQLAYLLDASDCHSPVMRVLGQRLVRMSAPEMVSLGRRGAPRGSPLQGSRDTQDRNQKTCSPHSLCPPYDPPPTHHHQMRLENEKQRSRAARLAAAQQRGNAVTRGVARAALQARFAVADHMSSALILAVFGFKVRGA